MASTNKTTNYDLSQYIGSDKPTYLSDYNGDMYKIDAQMKVNADNIATAISSASTATSTANSANTTAQTALSTAESASTTATSASTTAGNAQSTANSALATATTAQSSINGLDTRVTTLESDISKFNLTTFTNVLTSSATNGSITESTIKMALNSDNSIFKFYGSCVFTFTNSWTTATLSFETALRPSEAYTIEACGMALSTTNVNAFTKLNMTINTNGIASVTFSTGDPKAYRIWFPPCLYFNSNFGD